jgi:Protein of unknown function (DUF3043)
MLGRRAATTESAPADDMVDPGSAADTAGKGRPTPKRAAARKARRNAAPKTRREAAARQRDRTRTERRTARAALVSGDESRLPPRDAGPEKRLARDMVDSRFTYGQVFFGLILIVFALSIVPSTAIRSTANLAALFSLMFMIVDGAMNGRRAKAAVIAKYGAAGARGISSYAFMRSLLPRRLRRPPPKVSRGSEVPR